MREDSVIDWLRHHFNNPNLEEKNIKSILHFSLLWNLFEYTYFNDKKRLDVTNLLKLADTATPNLCDTKVDNTFRYFKSRYLQKGNFDNTKFKDLGLTKVNEEFCEAALYGLGTTKLDKVKCIF